MRFLRRIKCVPVVCGTAMFVGTTLQNGRFGVCGRTQYEMKDVFVREVDTTLALSTYRRLCKLFARSSAASIFLAYSGPDLSVAGSLLDAPQLLTCTYNIVIITKYICIYFYAM